MLAAKDIRSRIRLVRALFSELGFNVKGDADQELVDALLATCPARPTDAFSDRHMRDAFEWLAKRSGR
ncbi:MAG TPA: hypothetical protein VL403_05625 [Candidatus Kryptonia bacterium]|nr:hypothetical protein [Candidatus Kryptonia bacterium]